MVALAMFLAFIFFAGGCAVTYAIMETPCRKARQKLLHLQAEEVELENERAKQQAIAASFDRRESQLAAQIIEYQQRVNSLAVQTGAFERRVITWEDLSAENQILKTDLKNIDLQVSRSDYVQHVTHQELVTVRGQRDRLGRTFFEEVCATAKRSVTPGSYISLKKRLQFVVAQLQIEGVVLSPPKIDKAITTLYQQYEKSVRALVEREEQSRLREEMRENLRAEREQKEAQQAFERAEQERLALERALQRAIEEAAARAEKTLGEVAEKHSEEVDRLKALLTEAEAKSKRALSMAQQTKKGVVYVISNLGSFGENVYKIGMTRRLNAQDRIDELGDASVPFSFDVHMTIPCEDAPKMESTLHRAFHTKRVNKVNPRKEFFRVSLEEIAEAVRENYGEVEYEVDMEALEYRQSLEMTEEDLAEVEEAFTEAEAGDENETDEDGTGLINQTVSHNHEEG